MIKQKKSKFTIFIHDASIISYSNPECRWISVSDEMYFIQGEEGKLGIFCYNNKRLYYKARLILILKNKQQSKKIHTKLYIYSVWPPFFKIILSTILRNDLHVLKINSSDILFHSSSIAVLSEPIFQWEVTLVLFSKMFPIA